MNSGQISHPSDQSIEKASVHLMPCDVVIVGGGTAGLSLGRELKRLGVSKVTILEREAQAGGIPRHCGHYPFGMREYGRLLKGPDYARRNVEAALEAGVAIETDVTVTKLLRDGKLELSTPAGRAQIHAKRVVLCTGVRESSRAQRFIGGDRPAGVLSTAALQSLVYLKRIKPFNRPVILGSELVSFSAINTCRHLGIKPVAMIEEGERIVAPQLLGPYLSFNRIGLETGVKNPRILGRNQVEAVSFQTAAGTQKTIGCDGVIVSGQFRPEAALLRDSHLDVDQGSGGPAIDQFGRCSDPIYYSAGNLLRAVETSGACWREGVEIANHIAADLEGHLDETGPTSRIVASDPAIRFALPHRIAFARTQQGLAHPGMRKMQLGVHIPVKGTLTASSAGKTLWQTHINTRPMRNLHLPLDALYKSAPEGDIELSLD